MLQHVLEMRTTLFKAGVPPVPDESEEEANGVAGEEWEDLSNDGDDVEMS